MLICLTQNEFNSLFVLIKFPKKEIQQICCSKKMERLLKEEKMHNLQEYLDSLKIVDLICIKEI